MLVHVSSDCFKVKSFFIFFQKVAVTASAFGAGVFWVIDLNDLNLISFHPVLIQHNYREYPPEKPTRLVLGLQVVNFFTDPVDENYGQMLLSAVSLGRLTEAGTQIVPRKTKQTMDVVR